MTPKEYIAALVKLLRELETETNFIAARAERTSQMEEQIRQLMERFAEAHNIDPYEVTEF
jgi:hypothetical protein